MSTAVQEAPRVVQLWEGDGEEPPAIKHARQVAEIEAAGRRSRVQQRLQKRKQKFTVRNKVLKKSRDKRPLIRCHRFEMNTMELDDGQKRVHLHIITNWNPEEMNILPGDVRKAITVRYPMWNDPRDRFRRPVVLEFYKTEITQVRVLEKPMTESSHEIMVRDEDIPRSWEYSVTLKCKKIHDRSKKDFTAFRESICQPV